MFRDRIRFLLVLAPALVSVIACAPSAGIANNPAQDQDGGSCADGRTPLASCDQGRVSRECCPSGALCSPAASYCDLGNGACVTGPSCGVDAGSDADVCPGGDQFPFCDDQGEVSLGCCAAGAHCSFPASYCDFGNGTCVVGSCPADAGPDAVLEP